MIALLAMILELAGVAFLVVATLGVLRFADPFQRMHAATKAGTVGAGLVLIGTAISQGGIEATVIALLTMLFLVGTMPVAGHLLGRACYISGAPLQTRQDALEGVLPRMEQPLEERHHRVLPHRARRAVRKRRNDTLGKDKTEQDKTGQNTAVLAAHRGERSDLLDAIAGGYDAVRFAVIAPGAGRIARRAQALAAAGRVPLTGIAVVDEGCIRAAESPEADARELIRARLAEAVAETRAATAGSAVSLALSYEEGDPLQLIPGRNAGIREILLLPTAGWCHHGAPLILPAGEDRLTDKLFALAERHAGPTLFVGTAAGSEPTCVVIHNGSRKVQHLAAWALKTRLWPITTLTVTGLATSAQMQALAAIGEEAGVKLIHLQLPKASVGAPLPPSHAGVAAVIVASLPQPPAGEETLRDGTLWQDRLIPGFRGDVLVGWPLAGSPPAG